MKKTHTIPPGPRVVPQAEYERHGLDQPPALAFAAFSATFDNLRKALTTPRPKVFRCSFIDLQGRRRSLGDHSGALLEIANKMQTGSSNEDAIFDHETGRIFVHVFSTLSGEKRFPVVMEEVNECGADFRNMNPHPIPLALTPAPTCPKPAPIVQEIPEGCECRPLSFFIGWVAKDSRAKVEKALSKEVPRNIWTRTGYEHKGTPDERASLDIFTPSAHFNVPLNTEVVP
jgi:hypothetical protein